MSFGHTFSIQGLTQQFMTQLDRDAFWLTINFRRLKRSDRNYYVPDIAVIPIAYVPSDRSRWNELEVYALPLPLVIEIWSPSTGDYDIDAKMAEYMARGDEKIQRQHPFEPSLTVWRRQPDGSYTESRYQGGNVRVETLPGVVIDLDPVFP